MPVKRKINEVMYLPKDKKPTYKKKVKFNYSDHKLLLALKKNVYQHEKKIYRCCNNIRIYI